MFPVFFKIPIFPFNRFQSWLHFPKIAAAECSLQALCRSESDYPRVTNNFDTQDLRNSLFVSMIVGTRTVYLPGMLMFCCVFG